METPDQMNCGKCGAKLIKCYVEEGALRGVLAKNPEGDKLFTNKKHTRLNPYICGNCGFTEWFADNPESIR